MEGRKKEKQKPLQFSRKIMNFKNGQKLLGTYHQEISRHMDKYLDSRVLFFSLFVIVINWEKAMYFQQ